MDNTVHYHIQDIKLTFWLADFSITTHESNTKYFHWMSGQLLDPLAGSQLLRACPAVNFQS
jgi:hypothetical protein